ncbi:MAG: hypothetical protein WA966_08765, partial [Ornithinimicrobium sp.]
MTTHTAVSSPTRNVPSRSVPVPARQQRRRLFVAALVAGLVSLTVAALGISVRAADVGAAAVDEPQYLLTATSLR